MQQLQAFQEGGFAVDAYMQLYFTGNASWQIRDAWERAKPYNPGMLWIAVEDQAPVSWSVRMNKLWDAILACREIGATPGIYTAKWAWRGLILDAIAFSQEGIPLWVAEYTGEPHMDWSDRPYYGPFGGWEKPTVVQFGNSVGFAGVYSDVNCRLL